jgi:hypothetical protein
MVLELEQHSEGEECPITLQDMHTVITPGMEGIPFVKGRPDLCKAILPCEHAFSAWGLVHYWFSNGTMQCPVCRQGHMGEFPDPEGLPAHARKQFLSSMGIIGREQIVDAAKEGLLSAVFERIHPGGIVRSLVMVDTGERLVLGTAYEMNGGMVGTEVARMVLEQVAGQDPPRFSLRQGLALGPFIFKATVLCPVEGRGPTPIASVFVDFEVKAVFETDGSSFDIILRDDWAVERLHWVPPRFTRL